MDPSETTHADFETCASPAASPGGTASSEYDDDWPALDVLDFDTSLSFLADADAEPVPARLGVPQSSSASPTLQPLGPSDVHGATALRDEALVDEDRAESRSQDGPSCQDDYIRSETSSSLLPLTPSTGPSLPPHKRTPLHSRIRQKREMAYLREQVAELERELAVRTQQASAVATATTPSIWQSIALRQLSEKLRAERENKTLLSMVEGQLRVAQSLEKLLRKRVLSETDTLFVDHKRPRGETNFDLDMAVLEIRGRVEHQFATARAAVEASGIAGITTDHTDARAVLDTVTNGICVELTAVKVFPFSLSEVADAMWVWACGGNGNAPQAEFDATIPLNARRSKAHAHIRGVCERRVDGGGELIVFETVGVVDGPLVAGQAINCREVGYIVMEEGAPSDLSPTTILKASARMWPETDIGRNGSNPPHIGLFVDLILGFYNQHAQSELQTVENALMAGSRGREASVV